MRDLLNLIRSACGWEPVPDYLVRDRDRVYGEAFTRRIRAMGIRDRPTAPRSPWQNGYAERLIGSIRRECLDHVIVFGERHLRAALVPAVLQRLSDAPCVGQGLAANEVCPENREHSAAADPRRIAPSLRPDLISDKDSGVAIAPQPHPLPAERRAPG
jgi:transposase InsO family protein